MIPAVVTVMMCMSVDGVPTSIEVPGVPVLRLGAYVFPDLGVRFRADRCWIEPSDEEDTDAVQ